MRGYKILDRDFRCRGFQYGIGVFKTPEPVKMCQNGFHYCPLAVDCLRYYSLTPDHRYAEVVGRNPVVSLDKCVTSELTVIRELSFAEFSDLCTCTVEEYYDTGQIMSRVSYIKGRLNGTCTSWGPAGNKQLELNYRNGRLLMV